MEKMTLEKEFLVLEYVKNKKSITDISKMTDKSPSTVRYWLNKYNLLRSRAEGIRAVRHKMGKHLIGRNVVFSDGHKNKIRESKLKHSEINAKGYRINTNGYYEFTKGVNKGRMIHIVIAENLKGRKLKKNEVVHHIDKNKLNNSPENLKIMSLSDHSRLHAKEDYKNRKINKKGQFI